MKKDATCPRSTHTAVGAEGRHVHGGDRRRGCASAVVRAREDRTEKQRVSLCNAAPRRGASVRRRQRGVCGGGPSGGQDGVEASGVGRRPRRHRALQDQERERQAGSQTQVRPQHHQPVLGRRRGTLATGHGASHGGREDGLTSDASASRVRAAGRRTSTCRKGSVLNFCLHVCARQGGECQHVGDGLTSDTSASRVRTARPRTLFVVCKAFFFCTGHRAQ